MKKIYSLLLFAAILLSGLFAAPVGLYAQSEADLDPIKISSGNTEYWYFLQFYRREATGKVLTAGASGTNITQVALDGSDAQQWKIIGEWDNYQLVNKTGQIVTWIANGEPNNVNYFQTTTIADDVTGTSFAFVPFSSNSGAWQLRADVGKVTYFNDREGSTVCEYFVLNDAGNRLTFIPVAPQLRAASSLAFSDVLRNESKKLPLTVTTLNLSDGVTLTFSGPDADAFSAAATIPAVSGDVDITFSPTEKKRYEATLTLSNSAVSPVTVKLTGNADFDLPITISDDEVTKWYYIQFARQAGNGKVLTVRKEFAENIGDTIVQAQVTEGADADYQLWKITGEWDNYQLVNKGSDFGITLDYSTGDRVANVYTTTESDFSDPLAFVAFKDTTLTWQLLNTVDGKGGYLNDASGSGTYLARYGTKSDAGNEFAFLDPDVPAILTASSWDAGAAFIGETPKKKRLLISTVGITDGVTAALSGPDADAFTLSATTLQSGDSLTLTYTPGHLRKQLAEVTLTAGSLTKTIALSGTGSGVPVFTPEGASNDDSYWYILQFTRSNTKSWEWAATEDNNKIMQTELVDDTLDVNRWFKFVGDAFDFSILGYDNKVARIDPSDVSSGRFSLFEDGTADKLAFSQSGTDPLSITNKGYGNRYLNDNGGTQVGVYYYYDAGSPLLISEVPGKTYPASTTVVERAPKPYFSDDENEYWYLIQFDRTASKADYSNYVWAHTTQDTIAQQAVSVDTTDVKQWWKLVGDEKLFKIVNYYGGELAYDSTLVTVNYEDGTMENVPRNYVLKGAGEGHTHELTRASKFVHWTIINLEAWEPGNGNTTNNCINDFEATASALGLYASGDGGNPILFTLVPGQDDPYSIPAVETASGRVVAVKYYNLQGVEVVRPTVSGVYIVREILDSGQSRTRKAIYIERR